MVLIVSLGFRFFGFNVSVFRPPFWGFRNSIGTSGDLAQQSLTLMVDLVVWGVRRGVQDIRGRIRRNSDIGEI